MEYRLGTCSSCKAQFRVPATFQAARAKCKKCDGVVELGPVQSDEPSGAPAAKAAPARPAKLPAKPVPAAPKASAKPAAPAKPTSQAAPRSQAKPATAAEPVSAAKPATPAKSPAPRPAAPGGPRPVPQAKQPAAAQPARASGGPRPVPRGESVRAAAEAAAERVRGAGEKRRPAAAAAAVADAGGSSRSGRSGRSGARRRPEKKKSKAPVVAGMAVLLLGGGAGAWYFLGQGAGSETQAAGPEDAPAVEPSSPVETAPLEDTTQVAENLAEAPTETPATEAEAEAETPQPAPKPADPDEVDLSALEPYDRMPETPEERWTELTALAATMIDPGAGAAGGRARNQLLAAGFDAMPALVNELIRIDFSTDQGYRDGDLVQKTLMDICQGNNFGWKYSTEPADVLYNKKAAASWYRSWGQVVDNREAWVLLGKLDETAAAEFRARYAGVDLEATEDEGDIGSSDALEDF